jgi:hypothetical protein
MVVSVNASVILVDEAEPVKSIDMNDGEKSKSNYRARIPVTHGRQVRAYYYEVFRL